MRAIGGNSRSPNDRIGGGCSIRISREGRDEYFRRAWLLVSLELEAIPPNLGLEPIGDRTCLILFTPFCFLKRRPRFSLETISLLADSC